MASSAWRTSLLSPGHGENVFLVLYSIDVTSLIDGVIFDRGAIWSFPRADLSSHYSPAGHDRNVVGLLPGSSKAEYPVGETPQQVTMFINQFMVIKGDFLRGEFQALECVHSSDKYWWPRMVGFVLEYLKEELLD